MSMSDTGSYTPKWETIQGFSDEDRLSPQAEYSRTGNIVTVICNLGAPKFGLGINKATITVPSHLPVAQGFWVSGSFASDHYRNSGRKELGIVANYEADKVLLQDNNGPDYWASCWCHFVYKTSVGVK